MADDRLTDFKVHYDLIDATALEDAEFSGVNNRPDADIDSLKNDTSFPDYITWEFNHNVLDGHLEHWYAHLDDIAYFSKYASDNNGEFIPVRIPFIVVSFNEKHSSVGLTLYFVGDAPLEVTIGWVADNEVLVSRVFNVTSSEFFVNQPVSGYDTIFINFTKTIPNRYVKLYHVEFGRRFNWDETSLRSGKLVQEINMLGDKISINTLSFDVIDTDNSFNFGNAANAINYLKRLQPIYSEVTVNDESIFLGKYYLDRVTSENNIASFTAFSAVGLLDNVSFNEGRIYAGDLAGDVIAEIFALAGITSYTIDATTANIPLYGTIKPCTCREALQKVLFVCGSVVRTNSSDYQIIIEQPITSLANKITRAEKIDTKVTDAEYVTGVKLSYTMYEIESSAKKISTDTYDAGTHLIIFANPYSDVYLDDNSIQITKTSTFYIEFVVPTRRSITIYGKAYSTITSDILVRRNSIKEGAIENVKAFSTDLCDYLQASSLAYRILNYYITSSLDISIKTLASDNSMTGKQIIANSVANLSNYVGRYTSRVFDLTGGFVDDSKLVGYYASAGINEYYTTNSTNFEDKEDMYTGDYLI